MRKSDLKTGFKVEFANKSYRLVLLDTRQGDVFCNPLTEYCNIGGKRLFNFFSLDNIDENLSDISGFQTLTDIVKVYNEYGALIWERKEVVEHTMEELTEKLGYEFKIKK